jgi:hypothetical protein
MTDPNPHSNSSRELLQRIGLELDLPTTAVGLDFEQQDSSDRDLAQALRTRVDSLRRRYEFQPGDIVTWKPGLANKRIPRVGRPAVVVEILPVLVMDSAKDAGDPYFREPLDIVLGVFIEQGRHRGDFITWHFDSRRFQPWMPTE